MTIYTRENLGLLNDIEGHITDAEQCFWPPQAGLGYLSAQLEELTEKIRIEVTEYHFHLALTEELEKEDGLLLIDDGTMDTVLQCPVCNGWLRFDGRESAIMHMENDDECWLCATFEDDKGA